MGCGSSVSTRVANMKPKPKTVEVLPSQTIMTVTSHIDSEERLRKSFEKITADVMKVASPANQMTIVCLTGDTFPILVAPIDNDDNKITIKKLNKKHIMLPIVAASYSKSGRVVCFSQLTFLTNTILQMEQTMKLVTRSINWLCDGKVGQSPIGIFANNVETQKIISQCLTKLRMNPIEDTDLETDLTESKVIVLTSDADTSDRRLFGKLVQFTSKGGGIIVFYNHSPEQKFEINNFLLHFGLSYSYHLINIDADETPILSTCSDFNEIKNHNMVYLKETLSEILDSDNPDLPELEQAVSDIRHYLCCADERQAQSLTELSNHAWDYLNRSNYAQNGLICRDVRQCIVVVLILDIYQKIPLRFTTEIPEVALFPGVPGGGLKLTRFQRHLELPDTSWVSTGLYLPPGVTGKIKAPEKCPELTIQVGSHSESLLIKKGPWKRWPMVTVGFSLFDEVIEVGSQFGGIIYVSSDDGSIESIDLEFMGFSEYPLYRDSDPSVWEATKGIDVPWGEIETNSLIMTVPTEKMKSLDLPLICDMFSRIHHKIIQFLSSPLLHHDRIVFDVELADENKHSGYPIIEKIDSIEQILNNLSKPTFVLFNQFVRIAIDDIRENLFDSKVEYALGSIAAALGFQEAFPGFTPFGFPGFTPTELFEVLWKIHTEGNGTWIPQTLIKFQDPSYILSNVPEDTWISFVRELCLTSQRDYTPMLGKFYPVPLNVMEALQNLPKQELSPPS